MSTPKGLRGLLVKHLSPPIKMPSTLSSDIASFGLRTPLVEVFSLPSLTTPTAEIPAVLGVDIGEVAPDPGPVATRDVDRQLFCTDCLTVEILDLLPALGRPPLFGRNYGKQESHRSRLSRDGQPVRRSVPEAIEQGRRTKLAIDLFELIYPILLPPAATEFHGDLILPEDLYPFQYQGVKWLLEATARLLADEMGLGKTVQALVAFRALVRRGQALRMLVVCPRSVLTNWQREAWKWAPELASIQIVGSPEARQVRWRTTSAHIFITTYESMRIDIEVARQQLFDILVLDEAQKIKNPQAQVAQAARRLTGERRWCLTGTPLENRLDELGSILRFIKVNPTVSDDTPQWQVQKILRSVMLRRRKADVLPDLPPVIADLKYLELLPNQRRVYDQTENSAVAELKAMQRPTLQHVLAKITALKQICNFDKSSGESTKLEFVREYLEEVDAEDDKAILSSQFVQTLKWLQPRLAEHGAKVYSGELSGSQRDLVIADFEGDPRAKVLLLSLKAGGTGLNLQAANRVLHYDLWWNPAVHSQVVGRAHRIGQTKSVFVTTLLCEHTIEERIQRKLESKRELFLRVVDDLSDEALATVFDEEEIFDLLGLKPPPRTDTHGRAPTGVIRRETPYSNLKTIRDVIRACREYIHWSDPHFRPRAFEDIVSEVRPDVREILIISGDNPDIVGERARADFKRFRDELGKRGIAAEWRVAKKFSHDRYLITQGFCLNIPPVGTIYTGDYSEFLETDRRPPWESWWESGVPLLSTPVPIRR